MRHDTTAESLEITRTFDAPAALLFALWSQPAHFRRWMGPSGFDCAAAEIDFRVGGRYRAMIRSPEQGENWFGGVYLAIEPHRLLSFTFVWENDGPSAGIETVVTLTFEEREGKTLQTFRQSPFLDAERRDSHAAGWTSVFDRQAHYAATLTREMEP